MWIVQQRYKLKHEGRCLKAFCTSMFFFYKNESQLTVRTLRQVTLDEYKDMWEWVCFLVLGVSASVNQRK